MGLRLNAWGIGIIHNTLSNADISVYPNPANSIINIRFSIFDTRYSILIYDLFGREIAEVVVPKGQEGTQIDVSSYPSGIFIAVLKTNLSILGRKKFVISR